MAKKTAKKAAKKVAKKSAKKAAPAKAPKAAKPEPVESVEPKTPSQSFTIDGAVVGSFIVRGGNMLVVSMKSKGGKALNKSFPLSKGSVNITFS